MIDNCEKLNGKSLIFTDLHVGVSNDKASRQKIAQDFTDEIIERIETENIEQIFFLGDLFHNRTSIEVTSLNIANDIVRKLASSCKVFLIQGNHDLYEKYNSIITSLNVFDIENVNVISFPTNVILNGQNVLLVPWLCGTTLSQHIKDKTTRYDIMMGHFDISFSSDIKNKGQNYVNAYKSASKTYSEIEEDNIISEILHYSKDYSTIYLGHIHEHEVITFADRTWNIVGSPQFQVHDNLRLPDDKKMHGYYILDEENNEVFHSSASIPKFVTLYASDFINKKVDESKLKNSVVRRCYDVVLDEEQKKEFDSLIDNSNVYEEDNSIFILDVGENDIKNSNDENLTLTTLALDKFDYIKKQVSKLNHESLNNEKLLNILRGYYDRAIQ